ncbi:MAG: TatD family hydrolase [Desulfuromonas sp.]|nr:TatD family hydrolase [Desulfuromonas sp.]
MDLFDSHIHCQRLAAEDHYCRPCLVPAVTAGEWSQMIARFGAQSETWLALGVHPQGSDGWDEARRRQLADYLSHPAVVAVGEIGLDGSLDVTSQIQEQAFRQQLQLAVAVGKPVVIHGFRCFDRLLSILKQEQVQRVGGIVHGFSASVELAEQLCDLGLGIGVGRVLINPSARRLPAVVAALPAQVLVVETDAPWRSAPLGTDWQTILLQIVQRLAELRGWSVEYAAAVTTQNARRLLHLDDTDQ